MKKSIVFGIVLFLSFLNFATEVRMSKSQLCHTVDSSYYHRLKNYQRFSSLEACLGAGGRKKENKKGQQTQTVLQDREQQAILSFYSGKSYMTKQHLELDLIVPIIWLFNHGGKTWTKQQVDIFYSDKDNQVWVEPILSKKKGHKGLMDWLPSVNQCHYIRRFLFILDKYQIEISIYEKTQFFELQARYCQEK